MAINLNSSSTQAAVDGVTNAEKNKTKTADGFEDGMDFNFDDLLSDYNGENFGAASTDDTISLGGTPISGAQLGSQPGQPGQLGQPGQTNQFGTPISTGMNNLGIAGQLGQPIQQQQPKQPTIEDLISEGTFAAAKATGNIMKDFVKSFPTLTYDDYASYWVDVLIAGGIIGVAGLVMAIVGVFSANYVLRSFGSLFAPAGLVPVGIALIGFGIAALGILDNGAPDTSLSNIEDQPLAVDSLPTTTTADTLDAEYSSLLDSFDFDDDSLDDEEISMDDEESELDAFFGGKASASAEPTIAPPPANADNSTLLANMSTLVPKIDRTYLVNNFLNFLPASCAEFGKTEKLSNTSSEFNSIRSLLLQAISNVSKIPLEDLSVQVQSIESTVFSYTILVDRVKSLTKITDLEREVEVYFRENASDASVICTIETEHGFWKVSITKGASPMVTLRDCFGDSKVLKYFQDTSHKLPFIAGIDTYGTPILTSGESYTSMMTAGKQRSGKSWYICSVLMQMMTFNTPTDVQFLFIDPKKSSLYRTFSCMPHTIGVHDDEDIVGLLRYILEVEGERRKELLKKANHGFGVDSIKAYRAEGHDDMPYMYIVIDEFLTAIGNAEAKGLKKEFNQLIAMIVTQLPFVGIHIWIVPHRAQGAVDKTVRSNILYTAAVRCEPSIVEEVIDDKWTRPLNNPGDMALKLQDVGIAKFARAAVFARNDEENTQIIMDIAKGFYKINVDIPKINYGILANKDFEYICAVLNLTPEQREKIVGDTVRTNQKTVSGAGLASESAVHSSFREAHNTIADILDVSDIDSVLPSETAKQSVAATTSDNIVTDEDEEMLSRWRQYMNEENNSSATPVDTSGWDDDTSPFGN